MFNLLPFECCATAKCKITSCKIILLLDKFIKTVMYQYSVAVTLKVVINDRIE